MTTSQTPDEGLTFYRSALEMVLDLDRDEWVPLPVAAVCTAFGDVVNVGRHQLSTLEALALSQMLAVAVESMTANYSEGSSGRAVYVHAPLGPTERSELTEAQRKIADLYGKMADLFEWAVTPNRAAAATAEPERPTLTVLPGGIGDPLDHTAKVDCSGCSSARADLLSGARLISGAANLYRQLQMDTPDQQALHGRVIASLDRAALAINGCAQRLGGIGDPSDPDGEA